MLAGVDEAGRGPVLGPLVVAAVMVDTQRGLKRMGIKDSKLLSPERRNELFDIVHEKARAVEVRVVAPDELNARMPKENLNEIEVVAFAEVLSRMQAPEAIVDACDVDADRFGANVAKRIAHPIVIRSMHEADTKHAVVGAASIVAKVTRDRLMAAICAEHGACGSGYAHDVVTQTWLREYVARTNKLPPIARREWETARRLIKKDRTLAEFA